MFENLRNLAGREERERLAKQKQATPGEEGEGEGDEAAAATAPEGASAEGTGVKKKVNPWKVIEEHKAARAKLEAEIAELKKSTTDFASLKAEKERLAAIAKRNEELEETIKFVDYSKSKEFTEKYQKPYEDAWKRAMGELKELVVEDAESGEEREMQPSDLLELVNAPLVKAMQRARELYGPAADIVMGYRKEIRGLYDQQNSALEQARKAGVEKAQLDQQTQTQAMETMQQELNKTWEEVNKAHLEHPQVGAYFKPVEGDEEINKRLESGYRMVDEASKVNVWDPNLTPEQRRKAVETNAAIRHRAAAFGRVRHELESARKELSSLKEKLAQYEKSTPNFGGDAREAVAPPAGVNRLSALEQRLRQRAK